MAALEKLKTEILPRAVKEGRFGKEKVKFVDYKSDDRFSAEDQFSSSIHFGDVILETDRGEISHQSIVIKIQNDKILNAHEPSSVMRVTSQFYNEFLFYTEILPLLNECDTDKTIPKIFPKCFYASVVQGGDLANDILIFENVQKLGFQLTQSRAFISYDHIKLTIRWIAKFHALSLVCKRKFPERLKKVVSKIIETQLTEERLKNPDLFLVSNCKRGIMPLQNDPSYKDKLRDMLTVAEEANLSMAKIVTPIEPLAVICHGDLCRNNIFYKYNSEGVPHEVIFFDLATVRYSSPVIDLSFFLFMNSSPEIRSNHWDDILQDYHSVLVSNPDLDPKDAPSLDDIRLDFQRRGFYGYAHASFFLPYMLSDVKDEAEWWRLSVDFLIKRSISRGGEEATSYLMHIVRHMIDKNFDFRYIKSMKKE